MFIGHFAVGMAGKKIQPTVSLGILFLAAQFLDLLWPTLLLAGIEHVEIKPGISEVTPLDFTHYPISHSLAFVLGWSVLLGTLYFLVSRDSRSAWLIGTLVLSHWILDLIVHIPDLALYPGDSPKLGLGLWNSKILTILVEGAIFIAGVLVYVRTKKSRQEKVNGWFWSLVIFLVLIHVLNLFGPPPPTVGAIAWAGHLQWLFVLWAWYADKPRSVNV